MNEIQKRYEVALNLAKQAGIMLLEIENNGRIEISQKADNDYVTQADTLVEKFLKDSLKNSFPSDFFLGEEEGQEAEGFPRWVIDPIDGTMNFMRGLPNYTISIGWEEEMGNPILGVVYNVRQGELFSGIVGEGAFLNGQPIHVSTVDTPKKALLICEAPFKQHENVASYFTLFQQLFLECTDLRCYGSVALELCYIASGRIDSIFEYSLGYWDIAAGTAILRAAGGVLETIDRTRNLSTYPVDIIGSNGHLQTWISTKVRGFGSIRPS